MPLYDFNCRACGNEFEARVPYDELPQCPDCGATETERRLSPFAGPFTVAPRGTAAKRSNALRRAREEQRHARREQRRAEARQEGPKGDRSQRTPSTPDQ
jgi:putative FmdB family regulatory protein